MASANVSVEDTEEHGSQPEGDNTPGSEDVTSLKKDRKNCKASLTRMLNEAASTVRKKAKPTHVENIRQACNLKLAELEKIQERYLTAAGKDPEQQDEYMAEVRKNFNVIMSNVNDYLKPHTSSQGEAKDSESDDETDRLFEEVERRYRALLEDNRKRFQDMQGEMSKRNLAMQSETFKHLDQIEQRLTKKQEEVQQEHQRRAIEATQMLERLERLFVQSQAINAAPARIVAASTVREHGAQPAQSHAVTGATYVKSGGNALGATGAIPKIARNVLNTQPPQFNNVSRGLNVIISDEEDEQESRAHTGDQIPKRTGPIGWLPRL